MALTPTKLHNYAAKGDMTGIDNCLNAGVPINAEDVTKLHNYAAKGDMTGIDNCLNAGVPINAEDVTTSSTALHRAAKCGHVDAASHLHMKGADINATDKKYNTPIHIAVDEGHLLVVKMLITRGCRLDMRNTKSFTPIFTACEAGHTAIVLQLIESGANISKREAVGRTLLHVAGKSEIVKMLIDKGLDVNEVSEDGSTPLHEAVMYRKMKKVEELLKAGADPTIKNKEGKTPRDLINLDTQMWFKDSEKLKLIKTCLDQAMKKWVEEHGVSKEARPLNETDSRELMEYDNQSINESDKEDMLSVNVNVEVLNYEDDVTEESHIKDDSNDFKGKENITKKKREKKRMENVSDRVLGQIAKKLDKHDVNCIKSHLSKETSYKLKEDNKDQSLCNFQLLKSIQHRHPKRLVSNVIRPTVLKNLRSSKRKILDKAVEKELSLLEDDELEGKYRMKFARKVMKKYYLFGIEVGLDWATMERIECEFKNDGVEERSFQTLAEWVKRTGKFSITKAINAMARLELPYEETWKEIKICNFNKKKQLSTRQDYRKSETFKCV